MTLFMCSNCVPVLVCPVFNFFFIMQVPVGHPGEIDEIFDAISYSKGAAVIRMLHDYVGEKVCSNNRLTLAPHAFS